MKILLVAGPAFVLAGCVAPRPPEPAPRIVRVEVPVRVAAKCTVRVSPRRASAPAPAGAAADVFRQVRALTLGIAQRKAREQALENAIASCGGTVSRRQ